MADLSDSDLPDFSQIEAFKMADESSGSDGDSSDDDSSEYDSAQEEVQDGTQDGDYELDQQDTSTPTQPYSAQDSTDAAASNQLDEESNYGYVPPPHLPTAFKRKPPPGRPRLTPHERARREAARMLKKAEERSKRTIRRHETSYTKSRKAEICLYLLTQRIELVGDQRALRMREGISLGTPERMPGPGEELIRYRPVNFDDASKKWRVPVSTVQNWWRKRAKILGRDHPELTRKRNYFDVVPLREPKPEPPTPKAAPPMPKPALPVQKPNPSVQQMPNLPIQRVVGNPRPAAMQQQRHDVVHLGPPPGVQAYLWELGV